MSLKDIKKQIDEAIANVPKVYQAGYDAGSNIDTDAIYQDGYNDGHSTGYSEGHDVGFTDGKKSEYDAFWDVFQQNGTRTDYNNAFAGTGWQVETFKPKYKMQPISAYMMFRYMCVKDVLEDCCDIDFSKNKNWQYTFSYSFLTEIRSTINMTSDCSVSATFQNCLYLETISDLRFTENISMTNMFNYCYELTNLNITGVIGQSGLNLQSSSKLTHDSLMNIINALRDYSGSSGSYKVIFGNINIAKLTAEELQMIQDKGWSYS